MAYRTDQWENLKNSGETDFNTVQAIAEGKLANWSKHHVSDADNMPFSYPERKVRVVSGDGSKEIRNLKRGYIRNLSTPENKMGMPTTKCQFQFNPQYLVQSVSQNTSILNFLQQEPGQYAQPIPGNVSFNFDLFFDRSYELNQPLDSKDTVNPNDPWSASPSNVGVLHDIGVFFSVIGVGLNDSMGDYARNSIEKRVTAEINAQTAATEDDEGNTVDPDTQLADALSAADDFLKYNVGNTAFLLPLPVRVVFSSLYIVEGLVKDVTVTLTKFNHAMVPMQATLNVLFEAKYIGFAKKDTFFTQVLTDYENQDLRDPFADSDIPAQLVREYADAVKKDLSRASIAFANRTNFNNRQWFNYFMPPSGPSTGAELQYLVSNQDEFGGDNEKLEHQIDNEKISLVVGFPDAVDSSRLAALAADDNKQVSVSVKAQGTMYRVEASALDNPHLKDAYKKATSTRRTTSSGINPLVEGTTVLPTVVNYDSTTPPYEGAYRDALKELFNKVASFNNVNALEAEKLTPEASSDKAVEDNGGNKRRFKRVHKMFDGYIDDSNIILENLKDRFNNDVEVNVSASGAEELGRLFRTGLHGNVKAAPSGYADSSGNDVYDRSVDTSNANNAGKHPEYYTSGGTIGTNNNSSFRFIIRYMVEVTVSIDGNEVGPLQQFDYILYDKYGVGEGGTNNMYSSAKSITLDWSDIIDEIEETLTNRGTGSAAADNIQSAADAAAETGYAL